MREHHIEIGRDAMFDLLATHKLLIRKRKRRVPVTTFSDHWMRKYPNLIVDFIPTAPNQLWVSDITYITLKDDFEKLAKTLRYPLMVKHPRSYSSIGMTAQSRVETADQLKVQFERISSEFGAARVEEFIVGREFNVFIVDNPDDLSRPFVYPPTELIFPEGHDFWHADIKWDYSVPFEFREVKDADLIKRLQDIGRRMFLAMSCTGYGRCDVRMNEKGELFILEINPNGGILYLPEEYGPADYMILYDKDGYDGFFDRIFRSAMVRQKMRAAKISK